jgi:Bacterial Ig-like domain
VFARKRAPRTLRGTVSADPSGIKSVRLSIMRAVGKRCWAFDGDSEQFERHRCGGSKSFRIGDRAEWSYLMPRRLPRGRYTIRVAAIDRAGNDSVTQTEIRVR